MSDVTETLQELLERRLREMGKRRGRGEDFSLHEVWKRLPENRDGKRLVSYETVRRIRENGHTKISDQTADALATMLEVPVDEILKAAGQRPRLGRFELPRRADRLTEPERNTVLAVVDAILDAGERMTQAGSFARATPLRRGKFTPDIFGWHDPKTGGSLVVQLKTPLGNVPKPEMAAREVVQNAVDAHLVTIGDWAEFLAEDRPMSQMQTKAARGTD